MHWFKLLQVKHRELEAVTNDLANLAHPDNEARIFSLIGMTGIGKTTLATRILDTMLTRSWGAQVLPSDVPYIFISAPANGERSLSWRTLYQRALRYANEILIDKKRATKIIDNKIVVVPGESSLAALRESLEKMLVHRNVRLLVIDEAVHLLRFEGYAAVMDTLKSLADVHYAKILVIGSYDLFDLITNYGAVVRRGEILHYKRYRIDSQKDKVEFHNAVVKLQAKWPCKEIPNFAAISDVLMEVSLGSIGLLKALMLSALGAQIKGKNEAWDAMYLKKAAKSIKLLKKISDETLAGEEKLSGAAYGESLFANKDFLTKVAMKMGRG